MKKIVVAIMTVLLMFSSVPNSVLADEAESNYTEGYYSYTVANGEATITDCDENITGDIEIPNVLGGYPVVKIGDNAFEGCEKVSGIVIPEGVAEIGVHSFSITSLRNITIPNSLRKVDVDAFDNCTDLNVYISDLESWCNIQFGTRYNIMVSLGAANPLSQSGSKLYVNGEFIQDLVIPEGVTFIGNGAFLGYENLRSVIFPDGFKSIGDFAFTRCTYLKSMTIPNSLDSIGEEAFMGCDSMESVYISDIANWVTKDWKFKVIEGASETLVMVDSPLAHGVYSGYPNLYVNGKSANDITIPDGVEYIADFAFYRYQHLNSIRLPDSVTSIGADAFYYCSNLTSIIIPDSVTAIEDSVTAMNGKGFVGCDKLTILCNEGSYAHTYAVENNIPYEFLSDIKISGDVDGDGAIDMQDVLRLHKYVSGWDDIEVISENCDVNQDSSVDMKDVLSLLKKVSGWEM